RWRWAASLRSVHNLVTKSTVMARSTPGPRLRGPYPNPNGSRFLVKYGGPPIFLPDPSCRELISIASLGSLTSDGRQRYDWMKPRGSPGFFFAFGWESRHCSYSRIWLSHLLHASRLLNASLGAQPES